MKIYLDPNVTIANGIASVHLMADGVDDGLSGLLAVIACPPYLASFVQADLGSYFDSGNGWQIELNNQGWYAILGFDGQAPVKANGDGLHLATIQYKLFRYLQSGQKAPVSLLYSDPGQNVITNAQDQDYNDYDPFEWASAAMIVVP